MTDTLITDSLKKTLTYDQYFQLSELLTQANSATGGPQLDALSNYSMLNYKRMKRLNKTLKLDTIINEVQPLTRKLTFLVITESWCGDAAQSLPVMNKFAQGIENLDMHVVLRDNNVKLMNAFLTNGGMSIPKLILLDSETNEVLSDWGPRPTQATQLVQDEKEKEGKLSPEFKQELQVWYTKDKGVGIATDLKALLEKA